MLLGGNSWALLPFLALAHLVAQSSADFSPVSLLWQPPNKPCGWWKTGNKKWRRKGNTYLLSKPLNEGGWGSALCSLHHALANMRPTSLCEPSLGLWKKRESGFSVKNDLQSGRRGSLPCCMMRRPYIIWPFMVIHWNFSGHTYDLFWSYIWPFLVMYMTFSGHSTTSHRYGQILW